MIEFIIKYWLQILFGLIIIVIGAMYKRITIYKNKLGSTEKGVKMLLKSKIIENHNRIIKKENINEICEEYKNLNGNGVIKDLIDKLEDLEIKSCRVVSE